jgi:hypothetical protein
MNMLLQFLMQLNSQEYKVEIGYIPAVNALHRLLRFGERLELLYGQGKSRIKVKEVLDFIGKVVPRHIEILKYVLISFT